MKFILTILLLPKTKLFFKMRIARATPPPFTPKSHEVIQVKLKFFAILSVPHDEKKSI